MDSDRSISYGNQIFRAPWKSVDVSKDQMMDEEETTEIEIDDYDDDDDDDDDDHHSVTIADTKEVLGLDEQQYSSSAKMHKNIYLNAVKMNRKSIPERGRVLNSNQDFVKQYQSLYEDDSKRFLDDKGDSTDEDKPELGLSVFDMEGNADLPVIKKVKNVDGTIEEVKMRPVLEIPEKYRSVFPYKHFNSLQSKVFDEVMYSDKPIVVCAPTGSGKTVLFELCIIRLLLTCGDSLFKYKIVYMAPIKALCSERFQDWNKKFSPFGLKCQELTGDTEVDDFQELTMSHILFTTPEKWDSMTRRWKDHKSLVQSIRLFMIDEVHLVNDDTRGATMEAVVSRMKTVQVSINESSSKGSPAMRFMAVSATIPNVNDIAAWLDTGILPAIGIRCGEEYRPVALRKVVLGYPFNDSQTDFKFDMTLSYKLSNVIQTYSDNKPTLVFCNTRKSVMQGAGILVKDARFSMTFDHKQRLAKYANMMHDSKLQECVYKGVGFHHAGLDMGDRKNIEEIFADGNLPVLFCTSTLAMGVNLPAHLVIIKGTMYYMMGGFTEYSEAQVLQMMGRAGRPQYDTSATAVIMTKEKMKMKYQGLVLGNQNIESSLHLHLTEHVMAEVVLGTIGNINIAQEWLKSTFLYQRMLENPKHYGAPENLDKSALGRKLQAMCLRTLKSLESFELIRLKDGIDIVPTETGKLMARFCIVFDTVKIMSAATGKESLSELIDLLSKAKELVDLKIRTNEKKALNALNQDKNHPTIRFPIDSKIKTTEMKVNCLLQAGLGCLAINDFSLSQDSIKLFQSAQRIARFMMEYFMKQEKFQTMLNSIILFKCIKAKLWENSKYVSKQIDKIGTTLSSALVNAGITSFAKLEATNPRELEMIMSRHPPFGTQIKEVVAALPKYDMIIEQEGNYQENSASLLLTVKLLNYNERAEYISSKKLQPLGCVVVIGNSVNQVVFKQKIMDHHLTNTGVWTRKINVNASTESESHELSCYLINLDYVGLDIQSSFKPVYLGYFPKHVKIEANKYMETPKSGKGRQALSECNHKCIDKLNCGHQCCKIHLPYSSTPYLQPKKKAKKNDSRESNSIYKESPMISQLQQEIRRRKTTLPNVLPLKKVKLEFEQPPFTNSHTFVSTPTPCDENLHVYDYSRDSFGNVSDINHTPRRFDQFAYKRNRSEFKGYSATISERKEFELLPSKSFNTAVQDHLPNSMTFNRSLTKNKQFNCDREMVKGYPNHNFSYQQNVNKMYTDEGDYDNEIYEFDDDYLKNDSDEPLGILTYKGGGSLCSPVTSYPSHMHNVGRKSQIESNVGKPSHKMGYNYFKESPTIIKDNSLFNHTQSRNRDFCVVSSDEENEKDSRVPMINPYNCTTVDTRNNMTTTEMKDDDDLLFADDINHGVKNYHSFYNKKKFPTSVQEKASNKCSYNMIEDTMSHETPTQSIKNSFQKRSVRDLFSVKTSLFDRSSNETNTDRPKTPDSPSKQDPSLHFSAKKIPDHSSNFSTSVSNSTSSQNGSVVNVNVNVSVNINKVSNIPLNKDWQTSVFCDDLEGDDDEYGFCSTQGIS